MIGVRQSIIGARLSPDTLPAPLPELFSATPSRLGARELHAVLTLTRSPGLGLPTSTQRREFFGTVLRDGRFDLTEAIVAYDPLTEGNSVQIRRIVFDGLNYYVANPGARLYSAYRGGSAAATSVMATFGKAADLLREWIDTPFGEERTPGSTFTVEGNGDSLVAREDYTNIDSSLALGRSEITVFETPDGPRATAVALFDAQGTQVESRTLSDYRSFGVDDRPSSLTIRRLEGSEPGAFREYRLDIDSAAWFESETDAAAAIAPPVPASNWWYVHG